MAETRLRPLLLNLLLLGCSSLATLVLLDVGMRLVTGDRYLDVDFRGRHGDLVYEPNQHMRWKRIEWDIDFKTNSKGLRDYDYTDHPADSIVALGDSFTEGYGVELEESWGRRLAQELEKAGKPRRVYISGVQGLHPEHYFAMYDRFWKDEPGLKLAVIGFCVTVDVQNTLDGGRGVEPPRQTAAYLAKRWLCEHSVLYNFARRPARLSPWVRDALQAARLMGPDTWNFAWADKKYKASHWDFIIDAMLKFHERLRKEGRQLVILIIPDRIAIDKPFFKHIVEVNHADTSKIDTGAFAEYFVERGAKDGLPVLDLTPFLREANRKDPGAFYFKTDGHWTKAGHALAGQKLAEFLKARKLPPFR